MTKKHTPAPRIESRLALLTLLPILGLSFSAWLTHTFYSLREGTGGFHSICSLGKGMDCNAVALSSWAELISGLPLSSVSAAFFMGVLLVAGLAWARDLRKPALQTLVVLSSIGSVISLSYLAVMLFVVKNFCVFCFGIDLSHLLSLAVLWSLRSEWQPLSAESLSKAKAYFGGFAACLVFGTLAMKGSFAPAQGGSDIPVDEIVQSVENTPPSIMQTPASLPTLGDVAAPVTIVEFSDFQCPFCRRGAEIMDSLIKRFPGKLRVVFRNYPLDPRCNPKMQNALHNAACEAAKVALCAQSQGKFEPVYEALFQNQEDLRAKAPIDVVSGVAGLNTQSLKDCTTGSETPTKIAADLEEGDRLGIQSTPTFFLNGRKIEGAYPFPVWVKLIERELARTPGPRSTAL